MNQALAALYGHLKTASEADETHDEFEEFDLSEISAADLIAGLQSGDIVIPEEEASEKTAGEDDGTVNLGALSLEELTELRDNLTGHIEDQSDEVHLQKMAESGELAQWDRAGRIMAHAFAHEFDKLASANEPDEIYSIDDLSASDLVAALESGEFELVDLPEDFTKEAKGPVQASADVGEWLLKKLSPSGRRLGRAEKGEAAAKKTIDDIAEGGGKATDAQREAAEKATKELEEAKGGFEPSDTKKHLATTAAGLTTAGGLTTGGVLTGKGLKRRKERRQREAAYGM
jgi:hypothetical protein